LQPPWRGNPLPRPGAKHHAPGKRPAAGAIQGPSPTIIWPSVGDAFPRDDGKADPGPAQRLPERTAKPENMGAVVMTLSLTHALSPEGYYWYNIPKQVGFPFLSLVEHTNFWSLNTLVGIISLYWRLPWGGSPQLPKERWAALGRIPAAPDQDQPAVQPGLGQKVWVSKTPYAQPIPLVNHSKNIPEIKTPVSGIYFASMSQVYPWDRGTNFAVEIGRRAARLMLQE